MFCKAPGLSQAECDLELTLSSVREEASSDYEQAYDKLERMKQRVLQMKTMILGTLPTESGEPSTHLVHSDSYRLREIQLETSEAVQKIDAVNSLLKGTSEELRVLKSRIQESAQCTNKLAKQLDEVPKWMEEQRNHVGLCLERYQELDTICCNYLDYSRHMNPIQKSLKFKLNMKIPLKCYKLDYMEMWDSLQGTRRLMLQTREQLMAYLRGLDETLTSVESPPDLPSLSELTGLLQLNEGLDVPSDGIGRRRSDRLSWRSRLPNIARMPKIVRVQLVTTAHSS